MCFVLKQYYFSSYFIIYLLLVYYCVKYSSGNKVKMVIMLTLSYYTYGPSSFPFTIRMQIEFNFTFNALTFLYCTLFPYLFQSDSTCVNKVAVYTQTETSFLVSVVYCGSIKTSASVKCFIWFSARFVHDYFEINTFISI